MAAGVNGFDDLGVVDAPQIDGRDAEIAVAQLALDDNRWHALARELDGMGVPELVGRKAPAGGKSDLSVYSARRPSSRRD